MYRVIILFILTILIVSCVGSNATTMEYRSATTAVRSERDMAKGEQYALKALDIEPRSDVIVSPVTNPGGIMPIAVQNINLVIPDSEPNSFNISPKKFEEAITPKTTAAVLTHLGGHTIDLDPIIEIAKSKKIYTYKNT